MFMKRALLTKRSFLFLAGHILFPIVVIFVSMTNPPIKRNEVPALPLTLSEYRKPVTVVSCTDCNNSVTLKHYQAYKTYVRNSFDGVLEDIGHRKIDNYIAQKAKVNFSSYIYQYMVGATFISQDHVIAHYNGYPLHTQPLALNLIYNAILRNSLEDAQIIVVNKPIRMKIGEISSEFETKLSGIWKSIVACLTFSTAFFIGHPIRERMRKVKHLQLISGLKSCIFWITNFIWDFSFFLLSAIIIVSMLAWYQKDGYTTTKELGTLFFLLLLFGFGIIPAIYCLSYIFRDPAFAFFYMVLINYFLGLSLYFVVVILNLFVKYRIYAEWIEMVAMFFPIYAFTNALSKREGIFQALYNCKKKCENNDICWNKECFSSNKCCDKEVNLFTWENGIAKEIIYLFSSGIIYILVIFLLQIGVIKYIFYSILRQCQRNNVQTAVTDTDVKEEKDKIYNASKDEIKSYCVTTQDLTKIYGFFKQFVAVNKICFIVDRGQCFGLLGLNGAGKTSTFQMLTGDEMITSGKAWIFGIPVGTLTGKLHLMTGYCPQFDALHESLTGRQTLTMYSMIKGNNFEESNRIANRLANDLDFTQDIDKRVKHYSGGNKRKLCTAIAIIGFPLVIFLDEPTAGMDPATKRKTWDVLNTARDTGQSLVLTSHSMEECEALCTRVAIMVNGTLQCLGSKQHLKSKYSDGYYLTVQMTRVSEDELVRNIEDAKKYILEEFPGATLEGEYENMLKYYIKSDKACSTMFGIIERARKKIKIDDYSIGQCSLEQVFLMITREQKMENTTQ